ncbi:MAG: aminotransferase class IV [Tenuifilaceae bacterium]
MNNRIDIVEKYFVLNGSVVLVEDFSYSFPADCKIIYEVIRIKNSTPVFFDLHIERLWESVRLSGFILPDKNLIISMFLKLLKSNPISENNIRLSLVFNSSAEPDILIYFIPSKYPSTKRLTNGVMVKTHNAIRVNPNVKIENNELRKNADLIIKTTGCYEVLLISSDGLVAEGSRSNLFFVKNSVIYTPPIKMVLGGITRKMVFNICEKRGILLKEEIVSSRNLDEFDAAFLTGTSPGILPISSIDDTHFNAKSPIIRYLISAYNETVFDDIQKWQLKYKL